MGEVKKCQIKLLGETITLVSDEDEKYLHKIVEYIEETYKGLKVSTQGYLSGSELVLYSLIFITDQMFKERLAGGEALGSLIASKDSGAKSLPDEEMQKLIAEINALHEQLEEKDKLLSGQEESMQEAAEKRIEEMEKKERVRYDLLAQQIDALKYQLNKKDKELEQAKKDLNDFIQEFDKK